MKQLVFVTAVFCLIMLLGGCGESLTIPATGTIYGSLFYENGAPASGVHVMVEDTQLSTVTDKHGEFVINGALAVDEEGMGKYYVVRGYTEKDGHSMGFLVDHFKVKGQQSYSVGRVIVYRNGSLAGHINVEGKGDKSGVIVRIAGTSLQSITRADGTYVVEDVPVHEGYEVSCTKSGYQEMVIDKLHGEDGDTPIMVRPGTMTNLGVADLLRAQ